MHRGVEQARRTLDTADLVCDSAAVSSAVSRMAREITAALGGSFPLVLCVMRGAVVFAGQLLPQLKFPLEFDYLDLTRYRNTTQGGEISWRVTPGTAVAGRTVLVLDEGHTLAEVRVKLVAAGASRVWYAVLTEKDTGRAKPARADFVGLHLPDRYVFGCGMDVGGLWRNLPEIYAVKDDKC
jgi:hypoxanthine phosphoribosyltransferase